MLLSPGFGTTSKVGGMTGMVLGSGVGVGMRVGVASRVGVGVGKIGAVGGEGMVVGVECSATEGEVGVTAMGLSTPVEGFCT